MSIKISTTEKMPKGCGSWSLPARTTCPGSINPLTRQVYEVCAECYATKGRYRFGAVQAARQHNKTDWRRDEWVSDMVEWIGTKPYFRWFDSGDCYSHELASKLFDVIDVTPRTRHWIPTKQQWLPNKYNWQWGAIVRLSSPIMDYYTPKVHRSVVLTEATYEGYKGTDVYLCPAPSQENKCGDCRACWDNTIEVIGYKEH